MSLFSSLFNLLKKIISKLVKLVTKFVKKFWPVLLIVGLVYFAPAILGFLASSGAPAWLTTAFGWLSTNATPLVTSAIGWIASGAASVGSAAWSAYSSLGTGTQLAIAGGVAAAIAPEEFEEVVKEATSLATDVLGTVAGTVGEVLFSSPLVWVAAGVGLLWFLGRNDDEEVYVNAVETPGRLA